MSRKKVLFTSYCQLGAEFGAGVESRQIVDALNEDFELSISCISNRTGNDTLRFINPLNSVSFIPGLIDRLSYISPRSTRYVNERLIDVLTDMRVVDSDFDIVFSSSLTPRVFKSAREKKTTTVFYAKNALNFYDVLKNESEKWNIPVRFGELDYLKRYNKILENTDHVISLNCSDRDYLSKSNYSEIKVHDVDIGVDTERFAKINLEPVVEQNQLTFLFMGMSPLRKGLPYILEAWTKYKIKHKLIVAGLQNEFLSIFRERYQYKNIEFIGPVNPCLYFENCDVYLSPSLAEGQPRATMEAMSAGLPVIATKIGCGNHILHKTDGYVLDSLTPESIYEAVTYVEPKDIRVSMGARAREKALQNFDGRAFGEQFYKILNKINYG